MNNPVFGESGSSDFVLLSCVDSLWCCSYVGQDRSTSTHFKWGKSIPKCSCVDRSEMQQVKLQQHGDIQFCVQSGLNQKETKARLEAIYGRQMFSQPTIHRWWTRFWSGDEDICDRPCPGAVLKRTPEKIQEVKNFVENDRRTSLREVSRFCDVSKGTAHTIIRKDLGKSKKSAKWITHLLTQANKDCRVEQARAALQTIHRRVDPIPAENIVVEDESWILSWDLGCKQSTSEWIDKGAPRPSKLRTQHSEAKIMLVIFFDSKGTIHYECTPTGLGIGAEVYLAILERFREQIRRKRPQYWSGEQSWGLLHDGAPAHRADLVVDWLADKNIPRIPHAGYSPDLSPADYWIFNRIKSCLRGIRWRNADELQTAVDNVISMIDEEEYRNAMDRYVPRLRKCIQSHGEYFKHE